MNTNGGRVAVYLRVSTNRQTTENQRREFEAVAQQRGWQVIGVYEDAGISGGKGRDKRPAFDRLLKDATRGKSDVVPAWSVDRLGRSLQDLIGFLADLHAAAAISTCSSKEAGPIGHPDQRPTHIGNDLALVAALGRPRTPPSCRHSSTI
jgi:DNA invertase Pin-like site-specific DNA recombinase